MVDDIWDRIGQLLTAVGKSRDMWRTSPVDCPFRSIQIGGYMRAIGAYIQIIDLLRNGGLSTLVAAYEDEALILQGRIRKIKCGYISYYSV